MTLLGWLVLLVGQVWAGWAPAPRQAQLYNDGVAALSASNPAQAEALFRQVVDADPDCGQAQHGLGVALLRQNRATEALAVMQALAATHPQQAEALAGLSVAAFAAQDFDTARMAGLTAVALEPGSLEAVAALISALLRVGDLDSARQVIADARGAVPGPSLACLEAQVMLEAGLEAEARSRVSYCQQSPYPELSGALLSRLGGDAARGRTTAQVADSVGADRVVLLARAVEQYNGGNPAAAAALLDPLIAADGRRADARLLRARARYALGDRAGASADLAAAFQDGGGTWVDVHRSGAQSGILLQSHARALDRALAEGAALQVQIAVEQGDGTAARAALAAARAALGDSAPLQIAEARLLHAAGDPAAWTPVLAAAADAEPAALDLLGEWGLASPATLPAEAARLLGASARWSDRYNLALIQHRLRQHAGCVDTLQAARGTTLDTASHQKMWALGHRCAVAAGELARADDLLALLRAPQEIADATRLNHALLRYSSGDLEGTLALLRGHPPADPAAMAQYATLLARAHGDLKQWREAAAAAALAPPLEQYWLGTRLAESGHLTDARHLLGAACDDLDSETRARCSQLLLRLGGPL